MILINGPQKVVASSSTSYSIPATYSTYCWTVTGGTIDGPDNQNTVSVIWGTAGTGQLNVQTSQPDETGSTAILIFESLAISGQEDVKKQSQEIYYAPPGYSDYSWTVTGGTINGASNECSVKIDWASEGNGSINLETSGPDDSAILNITIKILIPNVSFDANINFLDKASFNDFFKIVSAIALELQNPPPGKSKTVAELMNDYNLISRVPEDLANLCKPLMDINLYDPGTQDAHCEVCTVCLLCILCGEVNAGAGLESLVGLLSLSNSL